MTVLSRVSAFIKTQPGKRFCDACIKNALAIPSRSMTNEATRRLASMTKAIVQGMSTLATDGLGQKALLELARTAMSVWPTDQSS